MHTMKSDNNNILSRCFSLILNADRMYQSQPKIITICKQNTIVNIYKTKCADVIYDHNKVHDFDIYKWNNKIVDDAYMYNGSEVAESAVGDILATV